MLLPEHEFRKPDTLADALRQLRAAGAQAKLLAGGTDVIFNMRGRLFQPDLLIAIKDLPELHEVAATPAGGIAVGASCRLSDLERHPLTGRYPGLVASVRAVASRHVRNMATLGGNLNLDTRCWYTNQTEEWRDAKGPCLKTGVNVCHAIKSSPICVALNASDIAPALLALDANFILASADGERIVGCKDFYTDDGINHTVRRSDEILLRVEIPPPDGRMVYLKETARKGNDFSYATIAAWANGKGEALSSLRVALGSLTTRPIALQQVPARLVDAGLTDDAIDAAVDKVRDELGVLTNLYTPAAYKGRIARSLVRAALCRLRRL